MTSAQELADRVQSLGGKLDRAAIAKIESQLRNVTLDEALLLALALNVSPVHLVFPLDDDEQVLLAPDGPSVTAKEAREWLRGRAAIQGVDEKLFLSAWVPESEWQRGNARVQEAKERRDASQRDLRVAKAMLRAITQDFGQLSSRAAEMPETKEGRKWLMLEQKLGAAYERVAEATVDLEDAAKLLRRVRDEEDDD